MNREFEQEIDTNRGENQNRSMDCPDQNRSIDDRDDDQRDRTSITNGDRITDHTSVQNDHVENGDQEINIDQDDEAVIDAVLHMADVADDDSRRLSSRSSISSISPRSIPVTSSVNGGAHSENGHRSRNRSPEDDQNGTDSGVDQDLVNSPVLTVACGYLSAKLYMDRFYCPGIHQLCIEYEGQFLTPKQFTIVAAKDKQKDWKGAIKINRQPVRILFERNLLDFYKHSEYCSGRCVSKSCKQLIGDQSATSSGANGLGTDFTRTNAGFLHVDRAAVAAELAAFANGFVVKSELGEDEDEEAESRQQQQMGRRRTSQGSSNSEMSAIFRNAANGFDLTTAMHGSPPLMQTDPLLYWNCISQLGLFNELTQEIEQQLQVLKTSFGIPELRPKTAKILSELVRVLNIGDKIQQKLIAKRTYTNAQCALLASELNELRKIAETQEKKQREVKRKSELLDHLIGSLQNQKRKRRDSSAIFGNDILSGLPIAMVASDQSMVHPSPTHTLPSP